jgi:hypothetical protein
VLELIKGATSAGATPATTGASEGDSSEPQGSAGSASTPIPQQSPSSSD